MTAPDLRTCPNCGAHPCRLAAIERVTGLADIIVAGDTAHWSGSTDMDWDSSATIGYVCRSCGAELPEDYATLLDRLLTNTREAP